MDDHKLEPFKRRCRETNALKSAPECYRLAKTPTSAPELVIAGELLLGIFRFTFQISTPDRDRGEKRENHTCK